MTMRPAPSQFSARWCRLLPVLLAWTGGLALAAPETKTEMSVQLPPLIIESTIGPTWRYTQTPRFEILSRCNDPTTERLALAFHRSHQLLDLVLPPRFQLSLEGPQALIFYDEKLWPVAEQNAMAALLQAHPPARPEEAPVSSGERPRVRLEPITGARQLGLGTAPRGGNEGSFFSNLMLTDADSITTFALVAGTTIDPQQTFLTPAYVRTLLEQRAPALPGWFTTGFLRLYDRLDIQEQAVALRPIRRDFAGSGLLPWARFFAREAASEHELGIWFDQGELLVCWGLDPANGHVEAFWKLVDRACSEPVTEALFQECFGLDFATAGQRLQDYSANNRGIRWELPAHLVRLTSAPPVDATPHQIARIKGEWERLEARYVRKHHPGLEPQYVGLARRTLQRAYDRGDRDTRLLVSLGLLELETDNKSAAVDLLAAAGESAWTRPRAAFELARLRYERLEGRSTRNDGKFTREQTDPILQPLLAASRLSPPLPAVYALLAHVSAQSVEPPSAEVSAALAQGARYFPGPELRPNVAPMTPPPELLPKP